MVIENENTASGDVVVIDGVIYERVICPNGWVTTMDGKELFKEKLWLCVAAKLAAGGAS